MKKLYLVFLALVLLFIPATYGIAVYQLDQPIKELDNYTLREVFENRNMAMPDLTTATYLGNGEYHLRTAADLTLNYNIDTGVYILNGVSSASFGNGLFAIYDNLNNSPYTISLHKISGDVVAPSSYPRFRFNANTSYDSLRSSELNSFYSTMEYQENITGLWIHTAQNAGFDNYQFKLQIEKGSSATPYQVPTDGPYSDIDVGEFNLTSEQMDKYYDLYLEAVRFENENIDASQDPGGYQNIFKSVINGVKGLIVEMGNVWQFLNAPIITSEMSDYSFSIDWSWDLIGVVRQLINSLAILILQTNFIFINLLFSFTGIPVQISILSMIFSNFVFVILGWIIVKSFII